MTLYAQIENNKLISYSNKEYECFNKFYPDLEYFEDEDKYSVVDGELIDISNTKEYFDKKLQKEKIFAIKENEEAFLSKEFIHTTLGDMKLKTLSGTIESTIASMVALVQITKNNLPHGFFEIYINEEKNLSPEMTPEQAVNFYHEVSQKLKDLNSLYQDYKYKIENASSIEDLNTILVDYNHI